MWIRRDERDEISGDVRSPLTGETEGSVLRESKSMREII